MARTITVQANMSMLDVVLQACGSMEALVQFCVDNDVSVSDIPVPGAVMVVSDAALALGDSNMLTLIAKNNVRFGTLNGGVWEPDVVLSEGGTPALSEDDTFQYSE